jgi:type IX secretion system PorP/SprF family membrane protein
MKTKSFICLAAFVIAAIGLQSQDQNYSQFFNNGLYYNPSYAGLFSGIKTYFNYRNQWTNLPYDFKSYNVAVDMSARNMPGAGGIGIIFHHNNEGEGMIKNLYAGLSLSTRIGDRKNNYAIQFGITAAICQKKIDWSGLVFPDQLDGKHGNLYPTNFTEPINSHVIYPDFNFGSIVNYNVENISARFGASIHHIFQPKIGFINTESKLNMKLVAHGDAVIYLDQGLSNRWKKKDYEIAKINPGMIYENQYGLNTFSIGVNGYKSYLYLGIWYRNEDINTVNLNSMVFLTGVNLPFNEVSRVRIMYSYDYIMNQLSATGGTHEISIMFDFRNENIFSGMNGKNKRRSWGKEAWEIF